MSVDLYTATLLCLQILYPITSFSVMFHDTHTSCNTPNYVRLHHEEYRLLVTISSAVVFSQVSVEKIGGRIVYAKWTSIWKTLLFHGFLTEASFGLRALSLPAFVCACVRGRATAHAITLQARITKFTSEVQSTLVKIFIVLKGDWSSKWNLTWVPKFTPFWMCTHPKQPPVDARTTKCAPEMQNNLFKNSTALNLKLKFFYARFHHQRKYTTKWITLLTAMFT